MARKRAHPEWKQWRHDPAVWYAESAGGLEVRVPADDGLNRQSTWCRLIGYDVDMTVRQLLRELDWKSEPGDGA